MNTMIDLAAPAKAAKPGAAETTCLIVFGMDDSDKPHASWFRDEDASLAEKAAGLMGMKLLRLTPAERDKLAGKLPQGRVFESGKAFVPFVNRTLYGQLAAMGGETPPPVVKVKVSLKKLKPKDANIPAYTIARTLPEIGIGQIVLAPEEGPDSGWWEAIIDEVKDDDLFILRWYGCPNEPSFIRRREHLTLLPAVIAIAP